MPTKHCVWGECRNDSRYKHKETMIGVVWYPFPKPKTNMEKCKKWIKLCGRPHSELNPDKISRYTYVCSKHFVGGLMTDLFPDPMDANQHGTQMISKKARPAPRVRQPILKPTKNEFFEDTSVPTVM